MLSAASEVLGSPSTRYISFFSPDLLENAKEKNVMMAFFLVETKTRSNSICMSIYIYSKLETQSLNKKKRNWIM